jgi:C-terminal processing protease CtpA/Prc
MKKHFSSLPTNIKNSARLMLSLFVIFLTLLLFTGCDVVSSMMGNSTNEPESVGTPTPTPTPALPEEKITINDLDLGVSYLYGEIELEDQDFALTYPLEVMMFQDATNFITHDRKAIASADTQELGYISINGKKENFTLSLPAKPNGTFHDVDNDEENDQGVQVFFISMERQHGGTPYFDNDIDWSKYFSSIVFADKAATVIEDGSFVVWAADEKQAFPCGFGDDGILFTEDDPVESVKQGYTVVSMAENPFTFIRTEKVEVNLSHSEPPMERNLSDMSYTDSFDSLFEDMKTNYAFVGISEKEPDWDSLYDELYPEIEKAEKEKDYEAFYAALKTFAQNFSDSHVSVYQPNIETIDAWSLDDGYGFMVKEIPNGDIIVSYIDDYSYLTEQGVELGDKLVTIDDQDIEDYLEENASSYGAYSREEIRRARQINNLTRDEYEASKKFGFEISDGSVLNVKQTAYTDNDTYFYGSGGSSRYYWPVEYAILESGNGYVAITSNMGGEDFTRKMFENALDEFKQKGVKELIIDLRYNSGGEMLKLVEYFVDEPVKIANLEYPGIEDVDGNALQYEVWAHPYVRQYDFDVTVLLGSGCVSACEVEAYAFSKLPDVKVFGSEPTAGAVALIYGESYELPEWIEFNYSIARFVDESGNYFLEGKGVSPNMLIPESRGTVSVTYDWLLIYVDKYLKYQDVMTFDAAFNPQPTNVDVNSYIEMLKNESQLDLDSSSVENYPGTMVPGNTYTYHTFLNTNEDIFAGYVTCTYDANNYENFFNAINVRFEVNGEEVREDYVVSETAGILGSVCRMDLLMLSEWSEGMNEVNAEVTYEHTVYDGTRWIPEGTFNIVYEIAAKDFSEE